MFVGIAGVAMDRYHFYNSAMKCSFFSAGVISIFLLISLRPENFTMVFVWFSLLGFSMLPSAPIAFNCAVECTFPVQEEIATGLLLSSGQIFGIVLTVLLGWLIDQADPIDGTYGIESPVGITIVVCVVCCALISFMYNGPYKRLDAEVEST